jgi:hypothetical protein
MEPKGTTAGKLRGPLLLSMPKGSSSISASPFYTISVYYLLSGRDVTQPPPPSPHRDKVPCLSCIGRGRDIILFNPPRDLVEPKNRRAKHTTTPPLRSLSHMPHATHVSCPPPPPPPPPSCPPPRVLCCLFSPFSRLVV